MTLAPMRLANSMITFRSTLRTELLGVTASFVGRCIVLDTSPGLLRPKETVREWTDFIAVGVPHLFSALSLIPL
jgi:hypothetical protein